MRTKTRISSDLGYSPIESLVVPVEFAIAATWAVADRAHGVEDCRQLVMALGLDQYEGIIEQAKAAGFNYRPFLNDRITP